MRIDADLTAAQELKSLRPAIKIVLTHGDTTYTIEEDRIKSLVHVEEPWRVNAKGVELNNADGYFTDLDLKGYKAVISYGLITKSGALYSDTSPMWVTWQQFESAPGVLDCQLNLLGTPDLMDEDEASESYMPSVNRQYSNISQQSTQETDYTLIKEIELTEALAYARVSFQLKTSNALGTAYARVYKNGVAVGTIRSNATTDYETFLEDFTTWVEGDLIQIYARISDASYTAYVKSMEISSVDEGIYLTIKDLLTAIAGATLACFSHCTAFTIEWDNDEDDDPLLLYQPQDSFRAYVGGSRLAAFKKALDCCGCVCRFEKDSKIHILIPESANFDYEYSLESGHAFFSKAFRQTLVIPNYIVVQSQKDDDPQYSGFDSDDSYALIPVRKYIQLRLQSNDEAGDIATAVLGRYQLNAVMGAADVPMNCGAELYDYIKVTDAREGETRTGNIGYIKRTYNAAKGIYSMRFGFGAPPIVEHTKELYQALKREMGSVSFERLSVKDAYIENLLVNQIDAVWLDPESGNVDFSLMGDNLDNLPDGETYVKYRSLHLDASGLDILEDTLYYLRLPGSATAELWKGDSAPTSPVEGTLWIDTSGETDVVKRYDGEDFQELPAATIAELNQGILVRETRHASLTAAGLVLVEELYGGLADMSGDLDDIANGTNFHRVATASLNAYGLVLLDQVVEGTYGLLRTTDLSAGHLLLSAYTQVSGEWYDHGGVEIDASTGINIYGSNYALTTRATKTGTIQCFVGSDGKLYAGAGAVYLDGSGLTIKGQFLALKNVSGVTRGYLHGGTSWLTLASSSGDLRLQASGGDVILYGNSFLPLASTNYIGGPGNRFGRIYGAPILSTGEDAVEGAFKAAGGGSGYVYTYSNGAWRANG